MTGNGLLYDSPPPVSIEYRVPESWFPSLLAARPRFSRAGPGGCATLCMNRDVMSAADTTPFSAPALREALAEVRGAARDQLAAAWLLHVERVQEELQQGWAGHIERIVDERFEELVARTEAEFGRSVAERVEADLAARLQAGRLQARRDLSEQLNQSARRLSHSESTPEWTAALLDAARDFCGPAALFSVAGDTLRCESVRVPEDHPAAALPGRELALASAPAMAGVVDGKDTLVVIRAASELGESLAGPESGKAYLFPLVSRQKVVAVLYAEPDGAQPVDMNALELLASLASKALETAVREKRAPGFVSIAGTSEAPARPVPVVAALSAAEQDLHSRAQRFARVQVAEMRLYKSGAVKAGRAEARLYDSLRQDIDAGRESFYRQFIVGCPSMVDYFHWELVRTLANEDPSLLGPDYPGPLV